MGVTHTTKKALRFSSILNHTAQKLKKEKVFLIATAAGFTAGFRKLFGSLLRLRRLLRLQLRHVLLDESRLDFLPRPVLRAVPP